MDASLKHLSFPYQSILILVFCFVLALISINQIIKLARPSVPYNNLSDRDYMLYSSASGMASMQNQDYKNFIAELSAKFPHQPEIAEKFNITSEISNLPENDQSKEIRFRILESRFEYLQNEFDKILQSQSEPLILKWAFYFWGFLTWMCSIVIGRVLEHLTDRLNIKYFGPKAGTIA